MSSAVPEERAAVFPPDQTLLPPLASEIIQSSRQAPPPPPPATELDVRQTTIQHYRVEAGDSLVGIAVRQGISVQTLLWANEFRDPDLIQVGQEILVPPVDGVIHTIEAGETLNSIAARYSAAAVDIVSSPANEIPNADDVTVGKRIVVPGGVMPRPVAPAAEAVAEAAAPVPDPGRFVAAGRLQWPTTGPITTYFMDGGHRGLDIAPSFGTPVYAADAGKVVSLLRWDYSFGWHIIVDHGNGMTTLYAHLSRFAVEHGDYVEKGQVLGYVGSTGKSTGPHLHFEVAINGQLRNPTSYLR